MIWIVSIVFLSYFSFLALVLLGWHRLSAEEKPAMRPMLSVIIAVRNEAQNIGLLLDDLSQQSWLHFEVIVVDDHSTDATSAIVTSRNYRFLTYTFNKGTGKKSAITTGVAMAKGDIIVTTDGDCRVPHKWLELIATSFSEKVNMVTGPVRIVGHSFFEKMQAIEFSSLIGSAASFLSWNVPLMCNGANLAYRREMFFSVEGFSGNEHIASGDDEFLMRKIHAKAPGSIRFLKNTDAVVTTAAQSTVTSFVNQRVRWASKWKLQHYLPAKLVAVFIFLVQAVTVAGFLLSLFYPVIILLLLVRFSIEAIVLRSFARFLNLKMQFLQLLSIQLVYPFYVIIVAVLSFFNAYSWKGRRYDRN